MKTMLYIWAILMGASTLMFGQQNVGPNIDADLSLPSNLRVYALSEFDSRDKSYIGSKFLFEQWQYGKLRLANFDQFIQDEFLVNYDLMTHSFVINRDGNLLDLPAIRVHEAVIRNPISGVEETYSVRNYENTAVLFRDVLYGEISLLSKPYLRYIKVNYNVALDAGNLRPRIELDESLYLCAHGEFFELPKKEKKLQKSLAGLPVAAKFLARQNVDLADEHEVRSALVKLNNNLENYEITN
jgi:hypothetical protein